MNFPVSQSQSVLSRLLKSNSKLPHPSAIKGKVTAAMIPLKGNENFLFYRSDSCEYILEAAVGKKSKKSARAMCRKWRRVHKRKLEKRRKVLIKG